jgi:hypothetical protein
MNNQSNFGHKLSLLIYYFDNDNESIYYFDIWQWKPTFNASAGDAKNSSDFTNNFDVLVLNSCLKSKLGRKLYFYTC